MDDKWLLLLFAELHAPGNYTVFILSICYLTSSFFIVSSKSSRNINMFECD